MKFLRTIFPIIALFVFINPAFPQERLDILLKERSNLYRDFQFYENQKSSFWGTQSKKDLKVTISVLRKIILKDSEIIKEINILSNHKNVQVINKSQVSQDWGYEIENENNKLKLLLRKSTFDYNRLSDKLADVESANNRNNTYLFVLLTMVVGLLIYILRIKSSMRALISNENKYVQ